MFDWLASDQVAAVERLEQLVSGGLAAWLLSLLPALLALLLSVVAIRRLAAYYHRRLELEGGERFRQQLLLLLASLLALVVVVIALPISSELRGQLFSLLGLLVSAIIALSSTTLVGNIMAGIMLRTQESFRIGDFIRVNDQFGRVSEIGLFHVEVQTEQRQLCTLPNTYLINHPVSVIHSSGTMVSCDASLGYDVDRVRIEGLLLQAAEQAGLADASVLITELGNYSVNYRVLGLLEDVKQLLTAQSRLRAQVLDILHQHRIEIASPTLMNTRPMPPEASYIPAHRGALDEQELASSVLESLVFDKAERAETIERLRKRYEESLKSIKQLQQSLAELSDKSEREEQKKRLQRLESQSQRLQLVLRQVNSDSEGAD